MISRQFDRFLAFVFALAGVPALAAVNSTSVKFGNSQYVSSGTPFFRDDASSENSSISLILQRDLKLLKGLGAKLDTRNDYSATENWNYLNVYQAYIKTRFPAGVSLDVGRKIETWSSTEDEWKQGVFQPRYMQNKLQPELAGLTGFYFGASYRSMIWTMGVLPVHLPDTGAHFWVSDHKLKSKNPWFDPPASQFRIRKLASDIRYSIDKPELEAIVGNPGAVAKVEFSRPRFGARVAAAFKPLPQLRLGFPSEQRVVVAEADDFLSVRITPQVQYHSVASVDFWTSVNRWQVTAGVAHDEPVKNDFGDGWTSQTYAPAWLWSLVASRALEDEGENAMRLKLGFLKIAGGQARDQGVYAESKSLFEGRFQYFEAYSAGLMWPMRGILKNAIEAEGRVLYDRLQNGGWLRLAAGYKFNRDLRVDGEADVLGLLNGSAEETSGFFSSYRANDRVGMGMTYAF